MAKPKRYKCSTCDKPGHNRTKCKKFPPTAKPSKANTVKAVAAARAARLDRQRETAEDAAANAARGAAGLPARLKAYRLRAGLSLRDMVTKTGHAYETLASWERGDRLPTADRVEVLAKACRVSVAELAGISRHRQMGYDPIKNDGD